MESTTVASFCLVGAGVPSIVGFPFVATVFEVLIPYKLSAVVHPAHPAGQVLNPLILVAVPDTVTSAFAVTAALTSSHGIASLPTVARIRLARTLPPASSF